MCVLVRNKHLSAEVGCKYIYRVVPHTIANSEQVK